jgi:transmembrane sensor
MPDLSRDLEPTLALIDERWDGQRSERNRRALHDKRRRVLRNRRRLMAASALAALAVLGFAAPAAMPLFLASGPVRLDARPAQPPTASVPASHPPMHMQLSDGSHVSLRDAHARVQLDEMSQQRVELALLAGSARFDVSRPSAPRLFRVRSGAVTVEVLGTSFELERDGLRTHVSVLHGRVVVFWEGGRSELSAGEADWFPRTARAPEAAQAVSHQGPLQTGRKGGRHAAPAGTRPSWREPAEQGDFEHAYELLSKSERPRADDVEELLLAADTARLSGHAAAALPFLKQVITQHARDSRASLAAFTLGGVLMQQLGQPREAGAAYARARELSLNASLAEDALARQVEAAHRAGDTAVARSLAREYLARYPEGRRIRAVQRFGELSR